MCYALLLHRMVAQVRGIEVEWTVGFGLVEIFPKVTESMQQSAIARETAAASPSAIEKLFAGPLALLSRSLHVMFRPRLFLTAATIAAFGLAFDHNFPGLWNLIRNYFNAARFF